MESEQISSMENLQFKKVDRDCVADARNLVLQGLKERFGEINPLYNSDLNNILTYYSHHNCVFLVGIYHHKVVCTGGLTYEGDRVVRIERVSVNKKLRGMGLGRALVKQLENYAIRKDLLKITVETNLDWDSAITLYKRCGYTVTHTDDECIYFEKFLR
ncbi:GNAT family N-acetyltransferase [Shouchella shacheensis]|uniref:GNAT family N-acetyltransferase n=1 Tax=Shouchella shacheensis TaxID=1649580 RepID=UPI0007402344|nr:GNAT family N-acetyltransferase [Shouchella shacheensis]